MVVKHLPETKSEQLCCGKYSSNKGKHAIKIIIAILFQLYGTIMCIRLFVAESGVQKLRFVSFTFVHNLSNFEKYRKYVLILSTCSIMKYLYCTDPIILLL